jgi:hypothetical protein
MHKVSLVWSSFALLVIAACGGKGASGGSPANEARDAGRDDAGEQMRPDAMTQMPDTPGPGGGDGDGDGDGPGDGPVACTAQNYQRECPQRPCEVLEGCEGGFCKYVPWTCGRGSGCPREKCEATPRKGGGYDNRCVQLPNDGCEEGESCRNSQCLSIDEGLNLWNGGFTSEGTAQGAAPTGTGLKLNGQIGDLRPGQGFAPASSGTLRLSGGLVPYGIRASQGSQEVSEEAAQ